MKTTFRKAALLLLFLLSFSPGRAATNFIQDVMVIGGAKEDVIIKVVTYNKQGWSYIDQDLNENAGGDYIFLLYKKVSDSSPGASFITNFYRDHRKSLSPARPRDR